MTPKPPLDFDKIESLRKHMLITRRDMATLLGVTRVTYYGWVHGKPVRASNDLAVRKTLKKLLGAMSEHGWPTPDVIAATRDQRMERLRTIIN